MVRVTVEPLPPAVLCAAGVQGSEAKPLRGWSVARTRADGDCLFDAVSIALRNPCPSTGAAAHPDASAILLRKLVSDSIVAPANRLAQSAVQHWVATRDASDGAEHEHVKDVDATDCVSEASKAAVAAAMRRKSAYWGEEYALRFLSAALQCTIVVLSHSGDSVSASTFAEHGLADSAPGIALLLSDGGTSAAHYSVILSGRAALHSYGDIRPWTVLAHANE